MDNNNFNQNDVSNEVNNQAQQFNSGQPQQQQVPSGYQPREQYQYPRGLPDRQVPQYRETGPSVYYPYQIGTPYVPPYLVVQQPVEKKSTGLVVFSIISGIVALILLVTVIVQGFQISMLKTIQGGNEEYEYGYEDFWNFFEDNTDTQSKKPSVVEDDYPGNPSIAAIGGELPSITNAYNPVPEIVEATKYGIGYIAVYNGDTPTAGGTGFVVHKEGYIVSNYHVAVAGNRFEFYLDTEDRKPIDIRFVGGDASQDVAVFKADVDYLVPLALGSSKETKVGEYAIAIGCPDGASNHLPNTVTVGYVSYVGRKAKYLQTTKEFLQIDTAINPGNSGGPVFNGKGEVIGIVTWKSLISAQDEYGYGIDSEGIGFAVQIDDVKEQILSIIQSGSIVRPGIGIIYQEMTEEDAKANNLHAGKYITDFMAESPAKKAGLQIEDVIFKCNGVDLLENDILGETIRNSNVGDKITVTIWRKGVEIDMEIIIADMNRMVIFE